MTSYSPEIQKDIAEFGRTIIAIKDDENPDRLAFSYTIGNSIGDNPTPELLCFFPHSKTVSWALNELSQSLRTEEIKPLSPGEVVQIRGVLGQFKQFPLLLKYLTPDEQKDCWDNYTCQLSPDAPVIQVEIPDTAGFYSHEPGSPAGHIEGRTPERLAITKDPDRFVYNLWGAPKNPINIDALRDNLRYYICIFNSPSKDHDPHSAATINLLHYLAEQDFNKNGTDYGYEDEAEEIQAHHDACIWTLQTLSNYKEATAALTAEDDAISAVGDHQSVERYWYGIKPTPADLEGDGADLFERDDFNPVYDNAGQWLADLNWELIRYALIKSYEDSLDVDATTRHRIMFKTWNKHEISTEDAEFLFREIEEEKAAEKQKRFSVAWFKNKFQSLFSK